MSAKIKYTDESLGDVQVIKDFLPSPEELAFKEETVKVTISLSKASVDFFKEAAEQHHTQYQKMIRNLLDEYTRLQVEKSRPLTKHSSGREKRAAHR